MDPIRNVMPAVAQVTLPRSTASASTTVIAKRSDSPAIQVGGNPEAGVADAEQRRAEAVQRAARDIANQYVLGDRRFTIFKDATGQYITRFTDLRDGRVTYIPEPEVLRRSGAAAQPQVILEA